MPRQITEADEVHKEWAKRAQETTLDQLPAFLKELTEDFSHDYGTIVHACAVAAVAAAVAVNKSPAGGITGFQASCAMWEFCRQWMHWDENPRALLDYDWLLFPQFADRFTAISPETWRWTQKQAAKYLADRTAVAVVAEHWRSIVAGTVPFGLRVEER